MKRKIYNADNPTPNPDECKKLIDSYNSTCEDHNNYVELFKKGVKEREDKCKENIEKSREKKTTLEAEIIKTDKDFKFALTRFTNNMEKTDPYIFNVQKDVKFYGEFSKSYKGRDGNTIYFVGKNLIDKTPQKTPKNPDGTGLPDAPCYAQYKYTTIQGTLYVDIVKPKDMTTSNFTPTNAYKAIVEIIDITKKLGNLNDPKWADQKLSHELSLQKLGFINDIVSDIEKKGNIAVIRANKNPIPTRRDHNGSFYRVAGKDGKLQELYGGGFKLIRDCKTLFVEDNTVTPPLEKSPSEIVRDRNHKADKQEKIEKLDEDIKKCQSYLYNKKDKKGNPLDKKRLEEKTLLDDIFKEKEKLLKDKMKEIKDKNCTAPTKCVQTIYNP